MKKFIKCQVNKVWCLTKLRDSKKSLIPFTANSKLPCKIPSLVMD